MAIEGNYYTVEGGDSYERIAGLVYGDQRMFQELMSANGGAYLRPGMKLYLPSKVSNPFVSNEKAAEFGMATTGQLRDAYAAGNPQAGWFTQEMAQANRNWAYNNYLGIAPGLVNGNIPTGWGSGTGTAPKNNAPVLPETKFPTTTFVRSAENRRTNTLQDQAIGNQRRTTSGTATGTPVQSSYAAWLQRNQTGNRTTNRTTNRTPTVTNTRATLPNTTVNTVRNPFNTTITNPNATQFNTALNQPNRNVFNQNRANDPVLQALLKLFPQLQGNMNAANVVRNEIERTLNITPQNVPAALQLPNRTVQTVANQPVQQTQPNRGTTFPYWNLPGYGNVGTASVTPQQPNRGTTFPYWNLPGYGDVGTAPATVPTQKELPLWLSASATTTPINQLNPVISDPTLGLGFTTPPQEWVNNPGTPNPGELTGTAFKRNAPVEEIQNLDESGGINPNIATAPDDWWGGTWGIYFPTDSYYRPDETGVSTTITGRPVSVSSVANGYMNQNWGTG